MSSVTQRIAMIKQPRGGYIKPSQFSAVKFEDNLTLYDNENIHSSVIGIAVDYLTRFSMGTSVQDSFNISYTGACMAEKLCKKNSIKTANNLLSGITGLDDRSITNACKLVTYDTWYRNPIGALTAKGVEETNPNIETIRNIRILVERSMNFWNEYGPIVKDGFTFAPNGYTQIVDSGDGDYLTADTLWDFKVSKSKPTSKHTLQLLMYWIMGQHSGQEIYRDICKIGIFNPKLNMAFLLDVSTITDDVITEVEKNVIGY